MAINFPSSPSTNDTHTDATSGNSWKYDGTKWVSLSDTDVPGGDADTLDGQHGSYYLNYDNLTNTPTASETLTAIKTVDGASSGLDADVLDGQQGSYYLDYNNLSNKPSIPSAIEDLSNVVTNNQTLSNGDILAWSSTNSDWRASTPSSGSYAAQMTGSGQVDTYGLCRYTAFSTISAGSTVSGSNLRYANAVGDNTGSSLSGTWMVAGHISGFNSVTVVYRTV